MKMIFYSQQGVILFENTTVSTAFTGGNILGTFIALNNLDSLLWQSKHEALAVELITCDKRIHFYISTRESQSKLDPVFIHLK